jgi:hypothetical protein
VQKEIIAERSFGKTILKAEESRLVQGAAKVLAADPYAKALLTGGMPEVSFFVRDPESGVMLKARMDYVTPLATVDVKTFSNSRGKSTDKAVFDAIYYEGYYFQCVVYNTIRELARQQYVSGEIGVHGAVGDEFLKAYAGDTNVYWMDAEMKMAESIRFYNECREKFEDRPWRESKPPHVLEDSDIPQLLFRG